MKLAQNIGALVHNRNNKFRNLICLYIYISLASPIFDV